MNKTRKLSQIKPVKQKILMEPLFLPLLATSNYNKYINYKTSIKLPMKDIRTHKALETGSENKKT